MQNASDPRLGARFSRLASLNILANLTVPLASLVDTAMLGHLPEIRFLAGVALASVLFDYLYWTFGFLRMSTTGLTAQELGRGDGHEMHRVLYRSLVIAGGAGATLLALQAPLGDLAFVFLQGSAEVEAAGRSYYDARIWSAPATLGNLAFLGWFLGREQSGRALGLTVTTNLANVAFNYLFIVRLGWGAWGAGLGTTLAQYLALAAALTLFARGRGRLPWSWREVVDRRRLFALFHLNLDILARTLLLVTAFAVLTNVSALLGTAVLAANSILLRLFTLASHWIDGAAFATESLAGIYHGGRNTVDLRRLLRLALATGAGFAVLFSVAILGLDGRLYRLFTTHQEVVALAGRYGPWLVPIALAGAWAFIYDGFFLGLTAGRVLRNAMLVSCLLIFLPLALVATLERNNDLLWAAMAALMLARALTLGWASRRVLTVGASGR